MHATGPVNKKLAALRAVRLHNLPMRIRLLSLLLLPFAGAVSALASSAAHTGDVAISADRNVMSVKVTASSPELDSLARRAFGGSAKKLVMSLLSAKRVTLEEVREMQQLLQKAKGEKK